jgi:hypothetical protein
MAKRKKSSKLLWHKIILLTSVLSVLSYFVYSSLLSPIDVNEVSTSDTTDRFSVDNITPPPGCTYQQVQCIKAPCDPILVCTGSTSSPAPVVCAKDLMICPDGTEVGRTGPECEFVCGANPTASPDYMSPSPVLVPVQALVPVLVPVHPQPLSRALPVTSATTAMTMVARSLSAGIASVGSMNTTMYSIPMATVAILRSRQPKPRPMWRSPAIRPTPGY